MLIDLHTHTKRHSWDSTLSPDELVDLAKVAHLDGVCLTEHDYFWDHDEVADLSRRHDFLVIPGCEITTETGHVLCFGLETYSYGMHRWDELAAHVTQAGGAMVAAHPYRRQVPWNKQTPEAYAEALERAVEHPLYPACTALEGENGRGRPAENAFSVALAGRLTLPATGGSDAHQPEDVGSCATAFDRRITGLAELIAELRAGRYRPVVL